MLQTSANYNITRSTNSHFIRQKQLYIQASPVSQTASPTIKRQRRTMFSRSQNGRRVKVGVACQKFYIFTMFYKIYIPYEYIMRLHFVSVSSFELILTGIRAIYIQSNLCYKYIQANFSASNLKALTCTYMYIISL